MQVQEVTQGLRVFKVSRGFVVISGQKETRAVKARRVISVLRGRRGRWVRQAPQVPRETSVLRDLEEFRVQPVLQAQRDPWGLRV